MYFATAEEMKRLDERAVLSGLAVLQMMELSGFHMKALFQELSIPKETAITIVCGKGNNGGNGLSAARHLYNIGYTTIHIILASSDIKENPQQHLALLQNMNMTIHYTENDEDIFKYISNADVCIDALIGYSLDGPPRGIVATLVEAISASQSQVLSFDIPTGLDATTGECFAPCINAQQTLALALPKYGFQTTIGKEKAGDVYVADLGIPAYIYDEIHKGSRPLFEGGVVRV